MGQNIGLGIGGAAGKAIKGAREENAISQILADIANSDNPQDNMTEFLARAMQEVAPENRADTFKMIQMVGGQLDQKQKLQQRREERLQQSAVSDHYKRLQNHINDSMKSGVLEDTKMAKKALLELYKEEEENRKRILTGEELNTEAIDKYFNLFAESEEEERPGFFQRLFSGNKDPAVKEDEVVEEKKKFDGNNPEHVYLKSKALEAAKGDKAMANKLLNEIFE